MWIKEKSKDGNTIFIINAKTYKINNLENLEIIELDNNYKLMNTIISKNANIVKKRRRRLFTQEGYWFIAEETSAALTKGR